jgi:hypothetical protein
MLQTKLAVVAVVAAQLEKMALITKAVMVE